MSLSYNTDPSGNPNSELLLFRESSCGNPEIALSATRAAKINECLAGNTVKYLSSMGDKMNLGLYAFIWNSLYFLVADTLKMHGLQYDVFKNFLTKTEELFHTADSREETAKLLVSLHEAVLDDLTKANISTNNRDGLLRAHQMVLILASDAGMYDGSVIPDTSQEAAFLLAATGVMQFVPSLFSAPYQGFAPVPAPQAPSVRHSSSVVSKIKNSVRLHPWLYLGIAIALIVVVLIVAVTTGPKTEDSTQTQQLVQKTKPGSGQVLQGSSYGDTTITIHASASEDCVVSLKTPSGTTILAFYVRSGDTVAVNVPDGRYYVHFAYGRKWYGYGKGLMFGKDTRYSKDDDLLDFANYSWEYTLYPVTSGNFSDTPSDEDEFF